MFNVGDRVKHTYIDEGWPNHSYYGCTGTVTAVNTHSDGTADVTLMRDDTGTSFTAQDYELSYTGAAWVPGTRVRLKATRGRVPVGSLGTVSDRRAVSDRGVTYNTTVEFDDFWHTLFSVESFRLAVVEPSVDENLLKLLEPLDGLDQDLPGIDLVNHPPHYTNHPSGVECIEITEHMGFNLGNAVKYIWRSDEKGDAITDLEKARYYVEREIDRRRYSDDAVGAIGG